MPFDLNDAEFISARQRIEDGESLNWLLINYDISSDRLSFTASGTGGLSEMKSKIAGSVCFAFCRIIINGRPRFVLVNYIPETISGVPKAHALVRSRQLISFFKSQDATISVDKVEDLTIDFVTTTIAETDWLEPTDRPPLPQKDVVDKSLPVVPAEEQAGICLPEPGQSTPQSSSRSGVFALFLRRKKDKHHPHHEPDLPLPRPSKDGGRFSQEQLRAHLTSTSDYHLERPSCDRSLETSIPQPTFSPLEFTVQPSLYEPDAMIVDPTPKNRTAIPTRRINKVSIKLDPVERARIRAEKQRHEEEEENRALKEEAERRVRLTKQKEEDLKREEEEAELRKVELEEVVRQAMAERKKKAKEEMEAELRKSLELEKRKRAEKEKRIEQSRRSEERRKEKLKLEEELIKKEQQAQRQTNEERNSRIKLVKASVASKLKVEASVIGWVTIQTNEALIWRRRFYKFVGSTWIFYRSAQDTHTILDQVELRGRVDSLREWYEGYEELKAIPHSFAIQFRDGQGSWSAFSDSEEDKYRLLGLLLHASGL